MKKRFVFAGCVVVCAAAALLNTRASEDTWLTDFAAARQQAAEKGRPILVDFSGSDWCGWCIRLDKEVFSKREFRNYADDALVLFLADFPNAKQQPEDVEAQNRKLAETYGVRGFPTVLLMDKDGKVLARTGYRKGGPKAYVDHLKSLLSGPPAS